MSKNRLNTFNRYYSTAFGFWIDLTAGNTIYVEAKGYLEIFYSELTTLFYIRCT